MAHPQIAAFARLAKGGEAPQRLLFGQATKLSRSVHDICYNASRDEFYVTNTFAQALLTFRGGADGQTPPIRIIQGPRTMMTGPERLEVDSVNNEIFVPQGEEVLVFPLTANGEWPRFGLSAEAKKWAGEREGAWA